MKEEPRKHHPRHEFGYIDKQGRVSDADLHDAILEAGGDSEAVLEDTRALARRLGVPEEMIERWYGKPRPKDAK